MILDINWLAVLVAAVVTFVLGGLWYGPLFGTSLAHGRGSARAAPDAGKAPGLSSTVCRLC